jgi:hypothetical protein
VHKFGIRAAELEPIRKSDVCNMHWLNEFLHGIIKPQLLQNSGPVRHDSNRGSYLGHDFRTFLENDRVDACFVQTVCQRESRDRATDDDDFEFGTVHIAETVFRLRAQIDHADDTAIYQMKLLDDIYGTLGLWLAILQAASIEKV